MSVYLKQFSTHSEYEAYIASEGKVLPNVSICEDTKDVHYSPNLCEEETIYELVGEPSYPTEIDGESTSFNMTFNYKRTDIGIKCSKTITYGSDTVTVEIGTNPSTASSRTVEGTYDYYGLEIEYSITQTKFEAKVTAKYNVTSTSNPTPIGYNQYTSGFSEIEIDGVVQQSVVSAYTFDTIGEHTVKYTLKNPTSIGNYVFYNCSGLTSIDIPSGVTSISSAAFYSCTGLTSIVIPDSVTSIGYGAFNSCSGLKSCTIGSGVTSISSEIFGSCRSLTSIVSNAITAPTIQSNTFQNIKTGGTLTVPSGSSGYDVWMGTGNYYLGMYNWTKVEQ